MPCSDRGSIVRFAGGRIVHQVSHIVGASALPQAVAEKIERNRVLRLATTGAGTPARDGASALPQAGVPATRSFRPWRSKQQKKDLWDQGYARATHPWEAAGELTRGRFLQ